jgi:NAD(P)-dependent dehydrogenase (short-subunit alcohol dehydrogenase family)
MPTVEITNSVAFITGGQRGIGKAFADELLARGARKVYVTARVPAPASDPRIVPLAMEVTDAASVAAAAAQAGDTTIVINNAGVGGLGPLLATDIEAARGLFEVNVFGALRIALVFAPILAANGGGALVDIHSALSWISGAGAYGAAKAAFWSLTNSLRLELAPQNTLVVGVHLGYTDTDMVARFPDVEKQPPSAVAIAALDALASGTTEVLVDQPSRYYKAALSGPVEGLNPGLS